MRTNTTEKIMKIDHTELRKFSNNVYFLITPRIYMYDGSSKSNLMDSGNLIKICDLNWKLAVTLCWYFYRSKPKQKICVNPVQLLC